jgi:hypothetical protein
MKTQIAVVVLALAASAVMFASTASAQEKTRAEVRQELIDAENNGRDFVTDTSYPDVSPIYEQQVARLKLQHNSSGPESSGASAAGRKASTSPDGGHSQGACVGPAGFCTPYFGT